MDVTVAEVRALIHAAKSHCTVGETVNALADVYGRFDGGVGW